MSTLSKGYTFGTTELVTNAKLHSLVDSGSAIEIVDADINSSAAIVDTKLAQISTANKVSGAALASLGSIPTGAGTIPSKKGGTGGDMATAAQGSVPYFSATGVMSALAAGTLGHYLKAGGPDANPSWEALPSGFSVKVLSATRDMTASSGDVAYTGTGFTPKVVLCFAGVTSKGTSCAVDDGTTRGGAVTYTNSGLIANTTDHLVAVYDGPAAAQLGDIKSFDANGFTITYSKAGSPTGTANLYFLALG